MQHRQRRKVVISLEFLWLILRKCLLISPSHCEGHRNLGNIQWLHYYDTHRGEIYLQKVISISSVVYQKINELISSLENKLNKIDRNESNDDDDEDNHFYLTSLLQNISYYQALRDKFAKCLAQSKSDYGGLLLMMFKYDIEAERELNSALIYDNKCISAHYYLGKHLFDTKKDLNKSLLHLNKYIELEINKNIANIYDISTIFKIKILKLDNKFVAAPLSLGCIFGKFEGKSKLNIIDDDDDDIDDIDDIEEEIKEETDCFKVNLIEIDSILLTRDNYDISGNAACNDLLNEYVENIDLEMTVQIVGVADIPSFLGKPRDINNNDLLMMMKFQYQYNKKKKMHFLN